MNMFTTKCSFQIAGEAIQGVRMANRVEIYVGMDRAQQGCMQIKETISRGKDRVKRRKRHFKSEGST